MKFKTPSLLYSVCPFTFVIDLVQIEMAVTEMDGIYYIDSVGAYLHEWNLFVSLEEAKGDALKKLNKFYSDKMKEIMYIKPTLSEDI